MLLEAKWQLGVYMAKGREQLVADCGFSRKDCFAALHGQKTPREHQVQTSIDTSPDVDDTYLVR